MITGDQSVKFESERVTLMLNRARAADSRCANCCKLVPNALVVSAPSWTDIRPGVCGVLGIDLEDGYGERGESVIAPLPRAVPDEV